MVCYHRLTNFIKNRINRGFFRGLSLKKFFYLNCSRYIPNPLIKILKYLSRGLYFKIKIKNRKAKYKPSIKKREQVLYLSSSVKKGGV